MIAQNTHQELTYELPGVVPATMHQQRNAPLKSPRRVECPTCASLKAPGAVVTHGRPEWSIEHDCLTVHRSIYCDGCRHVMHWVEAVSFGKPNGVILMGPGFCSGDTYIRNYLSAHPQAQEVEQI